MKISAKPPLQLGFSLLLSLTLIAPVMGQTKLKPGFNLFSLQQDVEIGSKSAEEVEKQMPLLRSQRIQRYISDVGERLAQATEGPDFPYQFSVVNVSDVNAFALPGGFMYVHRGLIEAADTEAEVAGVMAHELSHVALRHGTNQASKAYLAQAGLGILGAILGGGGGTTAQMIGMIGGFGLNATFLKFGRDAEKQSDLMGTQILARAGYDPMAMSSFFEKLRELHGNDPSKMEIFFSSHPAPADRAQYVADEVRMLKVQPRGNTGNFESIKADLERMPKAPSMKDLASKGGEGQPQPQEPGTSGPTGPQLDPPSRNLATFEANSGLYSVRFPDNWQAAEGSDGVAVTFVPRGGVIQTNEGNHIVYGILVNRFDPSQRTYDGRSTSAGPFRGRSTLERRANLLVADIIENNGYLKPDASTVREVEIANGRGLVVSLGGPNATTGENEIVTLAIRDLYDGTMLYFLFVTPEKDIQQLGPTFKSVLTSLRIHSQ